MDDRYSAAASWRHCADCGDTFDARVHGETCSCGSDDVQPFDEYLADAADAALEA